MAEKTVEELKKELEEISKAFREFQDKVMAAMGDSDDDTRAYSWQPQGPGGAGCDSCIAWSSV